MDWIEELFEKWKIKLKNFSLRKAMMVYLMLAMLLTVFCCIATWQICDSWKTVIRRVNGIESDFRYIGDGVFRLYYKDQDTVIIEKSDMAILKKKDTMLWDILSVIETACIPVYMLAAVFLTSAVYYKNKLREPISLMKLEMQSIRRNDLSFSCFYDSADEMGDICKTMDIMRKTIVDNQKNVWDLMEEQRKINAAFAHDLRTPLTVISGYVDMLMEYYPKGQVSEEKMLEILSSIRKQIVRMRCFSETMKEMDSFERLEVKKRQHKAKELEKEIKNIATGLENESTPAILISVKSVEQILCYDENIVMEVLGNLLSNALRYGKKKIEIIVEQRDVRLFLYVKDDGRGMTKEELYKADSPFYSDKTKSGENDDEIDKKEQSVHFGLGLTICKILCKKHGGSLEFSNSVEGGTIVCAEFYVG